MPFDSIPSTFRGLVLKSYEQGARSLALEELPLPKLRAGQVLVSIAAAPINPSDLVFLHGQYGIRKRLPVVAGFEGSGTVIACGPGMLGRGLLKKRVACRAPEEGHGTWAEYVVTAADACIPLQRGVSDEQGAMLIVNPLTAWSLMAIIRKSHAPAFIQTAAASALGQMMARLAISMKIPAIHIVRRPEQVSLLLGLGARYVLNSSEETFELQLKEVAQRLHPSMALDAVGGALTDQMAAAMPRGSRIVVYGALSGESCQISSARLIFKNQHLEGFWLTEWMKTLSVQQKVKLTSAVQRHLTQELQSHVQERFTLDRFPEAIKLYKNHRTDGKVLLVPARA